MPKRCAGRGLPIQAPRDNLMSTAKLVAVVEDEGRHSRQLPRRACAATAIASSATAAARRRSPGFANRFPDLVIIDVSLGTEVEGGFELCRELRAQLGAAADHFPDGPRERARCRVGLRLGADDYLTKRTSIEHLLARVAALFRRVEALRAGDAPGERLEHGSLSLDRDRMTALSGRRRPVPLTVTEFWVVHALALASWARAKPRAADGRGERRARRRHRNVADQTHPGEVRGRRPERSTPSKPSTAWAIAGKRTEVVAATPRLTAVLARSL